MTKNWKQGEPRSEQFTQESSTTTKPIRTSELFSIHPLIIGVVFIITDIGFRNGRPVRLQDHLLKQIQIIRTGHQHAMGFPDDWQEYTLIYQH